jgi:hypothetical protein
MFITREHDVMFGVLSPRKGVWFVSWLSNHRKKMSTPGIHRVRVQKVKEDDSTCIHRQRIRKVSHSEPNSQLAFPEALS